MTEQDKQLLIKDLSARLPYGVMIQIPELFYPQRKVIEKLVTISDLWHFNDDGVYIENVKPYFRPMSSMTEEEIKMFQEYGVNLIKQHNFDDSPLSNFYVMSLSLDWLNAHHFDYRGLIEKGLALEAPEGMYDIKSN